MSAVHSEVKVSLKADAVLVALTAFWGLSFLFVKDALADADPFSFLVLRFLVGALLTTAVAGRALFSAANVRAGVVLGAFLFGGFALQTYGLKLTTPSRSAFITGLCVVLVPFISIALLKKVPKVSSLVGAGLAVTGLYFLTFSDVSAQMATRASTLWGDLLTLGCAVLFGFHITLIERLAPGRSASGLVAVQLWMTCLLSAACMPFFETFTRWTPALVGGVLFTGIFATAVAITLQTWAQARTTAVRAALIFSLEPALTVVFAVALRGDRISGRELFGGLLILIGVVAAEAGGLLWARLRPGTPCSP